jgi:hypothetical protein
MEYKGYEVSVSGTTATGMKQTDTTVSIYRNRAVNSKPLHEYSLLGESSNDQGYAYGRFWIDAQLAQRA